MILIPFSVEKLILTFWFSQMEVKWGRSGTEPAVSTIPLCKITNIYESQV
jgi:hypothetical protein